MVPSTKKLVIVVAFYARGCIGFHQRATRQYFTRRTTRRSIGYKDNVGASSPARFIAVPAAVEGGTVDAIVGVDPHTPPAKLPTCFESALAVVPPNAAWPPLQRARSEAKDAGLLRWPPHANLLYPFVPAKHFAKLGGAMAGALTDEPPFTLRLANFATFTQGSGAAVVYLVPEVMDGPPDALHRLQARLAQVAPYCVKGKSGNGKGGVGEVAGAAATEPAAAAAAAAASDFVPHFTVTHAPSADAAALVIAELEAWWEPVTFKVSEVHMLARKGGNQPFELQWRLPLAAADPAALAAAAAVELLREPYPGMVAGASGGDLGFIAGTRKELQDKKRRGQRRKHRNSAAGKTD